jgi:acyl carrier protein
MISEKLKQTILKELELKDFTINANTKANEVPGWDSLRHISVIVSIEDAYGIRLPGREVRNLENIGELQNLIDAKLLDSK